MSYEDEAHVKEKIYDRQIRLWGLEAQNRMIHSNVLIIGLNGINIEACKNLVLSGINITIIDDNIVNEEMIENVFFLEEEDVGKYVAPCIFKELTSINKLITVNTYVGNYNDVTNKMHLRKQYFYNSTNDSIEDKDIDDFIDIQEFMKTYTSICVSCEDYPLYKLINLNQYCHNANIGFCATMCNGKFAFLFIDFNKHRIEESYFKKSQDEKKGVMQDVQNNNTNDTTIEIEYCSLDDFLKCPFECIPKKTNIIIYHLFALILFEKHSNLSKSNEIINETEFVNFCQNFSFNKNNLKEVCKLYKVPFSPACSIIGGVVSQEIRKYVTKQHEPIPNFCVFDMNQNIVCTSFISNKK